MWFLEAFFISEWLVSKHTYDETNIFQNRSFPKSFNKFQNSLFQNIFVLLEICSGMIYSETEKCVTKRPISES